MGAIPAVRILPLRRPRKRLKVVFELWTGSSSGTIHGFTQRGVTGMMSPPGVNAAESEGLNTSAAALALTVFVPRDQMRENMVGRPVRVTFTSTVGLMAKACERPEQSALPLAAPATE